MTDDVSSSRCYCVVVFFCDISRAAAAAAAAERAVVASGSSLMPDATIHHVSQLVAYVYVQTSETTTSSFQTDHDE